MTVKEVVYLIQNYADLTFGSSLYIRHNTAAHEVNSTCIKGRFPFNGLTGQTRIIFSVSMERSGLCFSNI
jgi:hypothetical protein